MAENVPEDSGPDEFPPESLAAIEAAFAALDQHLLPRLEIAPIGRRHARIRMGDKTEPFVAKVRDYLQTDPDLMPSYADRPRFERAVGRLDILKPYQRRLAQYKKMVDDSVGIAGSDAMEGALPYYKASGDAAKKKWPRAVTIHADLSQRFPRRPRQKRVAPADAAAEPPQTPGAED